MRADLPINKENAYLRFCERLLRVLDCLTCERKLIQVPKDFKPFKEAVRNKVVEGAYKVFTLLRTFEVCFPVQAGVLHRGWNAVSNAILEIMDVSLGSSRWKDFAHVL